MIKMKTVFAGAAAFALAVNAAAARELTFGLQNNETSNLYKGALAFSETLADISGGKLTVKLFPNASLGNFKAMVAQVQAGELDMVMTGYPDMSYIIPELKLVGAPYVVDNFGHLQKIVAGPWGQAMAARMAEHNIHLIDVWYQGTRHITSNRAIHALDDMQGLRLRTPNVPFLVAFAEHTGATPAPVAFQEVYLALQTNQVDARENPLSTIEAMKFHEVQSHIAMTGHFIASAAVQIGLPTWNTLDRQEKAWIAKAARAGGAVANRLAFEDEDNLLAAFRERGLTITRPDTGPFRAAMQPCYTVLEAEFGTGAVARVRGAGLP